MSNMRDTALILFRTKRVVLSRLVLERVAQDVILAALLFHFDMLEGKYEECDAILLEKPSEDRHRVMTPWLHSNGKHLWIVTEADSSLTTVFLPEEI